MSTKKIREYLEIGRDVTEHADDPACPHCHAIEALKELEAIEKAAKFLVSDSQDPSAAVEHMLTMESIAKETA